MAKNNILHALFGRRGLILLAALGFIHGATFATIIPSSRRITWDPGIPGGIPNRTTIYQTISAGASMATIQTALNNCPSNQVVQLEAGTYEITGVLNIPSYVTLRGSGRNSTILRLWGSYFCGAINMGAPDTVWGTTGQTTISSGATAGSTSVVLGSVAGVSVGSYLKVNALNDTYVTIYGSNPGGCGWCDAVDGTRTQAQLVEVTSVNGNTVTFTPALYVNYQNRTPWAYRLNAVTKYAGVESLKVSAYDSGYGANFYIDMAAYCWIKDVESDFADGNHVDIHTCYRCEVRDSYFHDGFSHGAGSHDDCVLLAHTSTACLIENNIFWRMHASVMLQYGAAGNVIAYNYSTNNYHTDWLPWCINDFDINHGSHVMFNLVEGNIGVQFRLDDIWGSGSHNTVLRNWMAGSDYYAPPADARGTIQWGNGYWEWANNYAFSVDNLNLTNNLVGNIAGSPWLVQNGGNYLVAAPSSNARACFRFGFDGTYDTPASQLPLLSAIFHGNYDFVTTLQHWDEAISDHDIPNSYYLTNKPAFFGNLTWPPIDPADPTTAAIARIPAGYRFLYGTNPPAGPVLSISPTSVVFGLTNGQSTNLTMCVTNIGTNTLEGGASLSVTNPWTISGAGVTWSLGAGEGTSFTLSYTQGNWLEAEATLTAGGGSNGPVTVVLYGGKPRAILHCVGDSLTRGGAATTTNYIPGGYRLFLYQLLTNAGVNAYFVGSATDNSAAGLKYPAHDGHEGLEISDIEDAYLGWAANLQTPHNVLLQCGINDFRNGTDMVNAPGRLTSLINTIHGRFPLATIIVTDMNPWGNLQPTNTLMDTYYNPFIPVVVTNCQNAGWPVYLADMRTNAVLPILVSDVMTNLNDNRHLDTSGYQKMASNFFSVMGYIELEEPPEPTTNYLQGFAWTYDMPIVHSPWTTNAGYLSQVTAASSDPADRNNGYAQYYFWVTNAGQYRFEIETIAPDTNQDGIFIGLDRWPTNDNDAWVIRPLSSDWLTNRVRLFSDSTNNLYTVWELAEGPHYLLLVNRGEEVEGNAKIRTVFLKSNETNIPPGIITAPTDLELSEGETLSLSVIASGSPTLYYQWQTGGTNITGATTTSYSKLAVLADAGTFGVVITNEWGSTNSSCTVTVAATNTLPSITSQPNNWTTPLNGIAYFSVGALGTVPLAYQWRHAGTNLPNRTSIPFKWTITTTNDDGEYDVIITNVAGSITSEVAVLTVTYYGNLPEISAQPSSLNKTNGDSASFWVLATGIISGYQWRKNGSFISGANQSVYAMFPVHPRNNGSYDVVVMNQYGSVTSEIATLSVYWPIRTAPPPWFMSHITP